MPRLGLFVVKGGRRGGDGPGIKTLEGEKVWDSGDVREDTTDLQQETEDKKAGWAQTRKKKKTDIFIFILPSRDPKISRHFIVNLGRLMERSLNPLDSPHASIWERAHGMRLERGGKTRKAIG